MGNTHSQGVSGRQLSPELIFEMAKWIPLKVERRQEKSTKFGAEIKRIVHLLHKESAQKKIERKWREWDAMCITYIGPQNESLLMASFDLTYFLLQRSHAGHQMIENLATGFKYEEYYPIINFWPSYLIKKKAISATDEDGNNENLLPISLVEMLRHLCFGHLNEKYGPRLFAKKCGTMPDDFQTSFFIHFFVEYTKQTKATEMIANGFEIHLTEQQYECAIEALQCYGFDERKAEVNWRNVHKTDNGFELSLSRSKENNRDLFLLRFNLNPYRFF